ncbi:MAG: AAA family ATPase, partial [Deltaproteobacteria bacterium]|nr:AAA family ATPase [Deltaproteobacteria bacterium]
MAEWLTGSRHCWLTASFQEGPWPEGSIMTQDSTTPQDFPGLHLGMSAFEVLRRKNFVYVDKTKYFLDLLKEPKFIFCARPRRFGKSLTLSALDAFFSGREELFRGLAAESYMRSPDFLARPVIRLDMSVAVPGDTIADLSASVMDILRENAARHNVSLHGPNIANVFYNLISDVYNSTGNEVVLLIDEYDAPVIDAIVSTHKKISNPELLSARRSAMQDFYLMIKSSEARIEMAFITGITKFSRMGV